MKHFLEISQLSRQHIQSLLDRSIQFKSTRHYPSYTDRVMVNLFYENSTRTRASFELAAKHLSMKVIHVDLQNSSENKGEVVEDTLKTLSAMGVSHFVIRHQHNGLPQQLADLLVDEAVHIVNAGDGTHAHPSQALLDMMTILEKKSRLDELKIAILGDIKHSRVANSFQVICQKMGVGELVLIAPEIWQPDVIHFGTATTHTARGLKDADVVICLRVQRERLLDIDHLDMAWYRKHFALTQQSLAHAKPDVMVMHPGPINRGIEIDADVVDGPLSCVLEQVRHGVFARMAILDALG